MVKKVRGVAATSTRGEEASTATLVRGCDGDISEGLGKGEGRGRGTGEKRGKKKRKKK